MPSVLSFISHRARWWERVENIVAVKSVGSWIERGNQYCTKGSDVLLARLGVKPGARTDKPRGVSLCFFGHQKTYDMCCIY